MQEKLTNRGPLSQSTCKHSLYTLRFAKLVSQVWRKACYRLRRVHPWPGGIRTRWTINDVSW